VAIQQGSAKRAERQHAAIYDSDAHHRFIIIIISLSINVKIQSKGAGLSKGVGAMEEVFPCSRTFGGTPSLKKH